MKTTGHPTVVPWHVAHAVRGDLLARAGRHDEAAAAFRDAAALTRNAEERLILLERQRCQASLGASGSRPRR